MLWTEADKPDKMDSKGIETVRRDMCRLVGVVVQQVLDHLLIDNSVQRAQDYVKSIVERLSKNEIDMSLLIITRTLSKTTYQNKEPHAELQKKMIKRDPGSAPVTGDRVAYVYVSRGTKVFEKAEDPNYVLQHNLPIDVSYYLTNQLAKPVVRIFEPMMRNKKHAYDTLFGGVETLRVKKEISHEKNSIFRHTVPVQTCLGCNTRSSTSICGHCEPKRAQIVQERSKKLCEAQDRYTQLWMQCQTCQHSLTRKVICGATDCPIYYMRTRAVRQLHEQEDLWVKVNASELF